MSSSTGYQYGISGPFWYAAGATIQILLFAIVAIHLKRKAPHAHTFLEFIGQRFDRKNHKLMLVFALMTNIIVTSMVILGGAIALNQLTGMNIFIAAFLIPVTFTIYTMIGGLKASFIADYFNTVMIFLVLLIFAVAVHL
jgi:Na+/proline symporter